QEKSGWTRSRAACKAEFCRRTKRARKRICPRSNTAASRESNSKLSRCLLRARLANPQSQAARPFRVRRQRRLQGANPRRRCRGCRCCVSTWMSEAGLKQISLPDHSSSNDLLPDALRDALGKVIADSRRQLQRERAEIEAEHQQRLAENRQQS